MPSSCLNTFSRGTESAPKARRFVHPGGCAAPSGRDRFMIGNPGRRSRTRWPRADICSLFRGNNCAQSVSHECLGSVREGTDDTESRRPGSKGNSQNEFVVQHILLFGKKNARRQLLPLGQNLPMTIRFNGMNMLLGSTQSLFLLRWLALMVVVSLAGTAFGADNVWSVQTLNDNKPWDKFVESAIPIRIEGRIGNSGSGQLRLQRCDAKFTIDAAKLRSVAPKSTVEITGRFKKDAGKLEFAIDDLKVVPSYADQYESRVAKFKRATVSDWMELGDWAAKLAHFYDDDDLQKRTIAAYTKAVDVEYDSLKATDAEGRFSLARKVDDLKLSPRRRMEFVHEGLRIQWQALQKAEPLDLSAWEKFAKGLADHLSGTIEPLTKVTRDLKENYDQDPIITYRKANDDQRIQLHRLFSVAVTRKRLMQSAAMDGSNGDKIADQIEQLIPEESALADEQRLKRLDYRVANINNATRVEAESVATALRERGKNDVAKKMLTQWIKSHEVRLKGDGVVGLLQLADEYLSLLNDEAVAVEYLSDAYRMDPTFEDVKARLTSLGYQWRKSRWMKGDAGRSDVSSVTAPQSPTGIERGMSANDLRKLLGQPGSLSRAITARGITEVWSFGPPGASRLVVRLEQIGLKADLKVTAATNTK
jgi:hypothetical protein